MSDLVKVHKDVIQRLVDKYGQNKVDEVNSMSPQVTMVIMDGQEVPNVTDEQKEIIFDFARWTTEHPLSGCTKRYKRPERILH